MSSRENPQPVTRNSPIRIYLIGFMGSGKSYLGKQLAEQLQWKFIDLDAYLESKESKTISQIFEEGGEALFRQLEKDYLTATGDFEKTVIATGGGCPCFYDNMEWMDVIGQTIYLKTPVSILVKRLQSETEHRPLLAGKSNKELSDFIEQKLKERKAYYEQAQVIFEYRSGTEGVKELADLLR